jgi:hypothetical protein
MVGRHNLRTYYTFRLIQRTDLTIRMEREELLKRKSEFDIAREGSNKRKFALASHSRSSYTSEVEQSHSAAQSQRSSRSVSYHNSQDPIQQNSYLAHCRPSATLLSLSSTGSGSHRRHRRRASSITPSSHSRSSLVSAASSRQSSAASVQRASDEENRSHYPRYPAAPCANSQALSFVEGCQILERTSASTYTSSSLPGARPKRIDPPTLCGPNVEDGSPSCLESSRDSSMIDAVQEEEGEVHVIEADNEDKESPQQKPSVSTPRSESPSPSDVQRSVHTPQPRSPHIFQPDMVERGMEAMRRWYGHAQPQTPSTPTRRRVAMLRTRCTDPLPMPIPTSPEGESELQLCEDNGDASFPPPSVPSKYINRSDNASILLILHSLNMGRREAYLGAL